MKKSEIVERLERIKQEAYADQPLAFGSLITLIDLLQVVFCEHEWEHKHRADDGPLYTCCKKCGYEP